MSWFTDVASKADRELQRLKFTGFDPSEQYRADKKVSIMFESLAAGVTHDFSSYTTSEREDFLVFVTGFKAFITGYNDAFTSDWTPTTVFGRNDPILNFKGTQRNISLQFDVVAYDEEEAVHNLRKVSKLVQQLYPGYSAEAMGRTANISRPPLVKMKFAQLVADHSTEAGSSYSTGFGGTEEPSTGGLMGAIKSLSITPNFDAGVFDSLGPAAIYPKIIGISLEFAPLHQSALGWDADNTFMGTDNDDRRWPYGTSLPSYEAARGARTMASAEEAIAGLTGGGTSETNEGSLVTQVENNTEEYTDEQAGGSYAETVRDESASIGLPAQGAGGS